MKTIKILFLAIIWLAFQAFPAAVSAQRSGVEIWSQTCGNCHKSQPASRYTTRRWESIATHMKIYARLTDGETRTVLEFLKNGAKDAATVIPASTDEANATVVASTDADNPTNEGYQLTKEEVKALREYIRKSENKKSEKKDIEREER